MRETQNFLNVFLLFFWGSEDEDGKVRANQGQESDDACTIVVPL